MSLDLQAAAFTEALKRCESEPIAYIGAIQSHGVLLAVDEFWLIEVASNNLQDMLGISAAQALGQNVRDVLGLVSCQAIAALGVQQAGCQPQPVTLQLATDARQRQAQVHRSGSLLVIEIEGHEPGAELVHPMNVDATDALMTALLAPTDSIEDFATCITTQVQANTGFDRVMVYQFDPQWNGKVIAESCRAGIAPLLGNHFPASDIPPPARALYTRNLVRLLVNRSAPAVALGQRSIDGMHCPLDLSFSVLRSMSPIHLEYLGNLGVNASLTVSLLQHGKLWGLIACHHEHPRQLAFRLRQSMELLAKTVAMRLSAMAFDESTHYHNRVRALLPKLTGPVGLVQRSGGGLLSPKLQHEVLDLVHASGAVIGAGATLMPIGLTPTHPQLQALLDWLRPQLMASPTYVTHALGQDYPSATAFADIASGLLAIRLDLKAQDCLLWFRAEVIQTTTWAGEAAKHLVQDEFGPKLEPRRSFAQWVQTRRGEAQHWSGLEIDVAQTLSLTLAEVFSRQQLQAGEESRRLAASVYENSSEAMVVTNADNIILTINPAFTALTGYSSAEVVGRSPEVLKSGRHDARFYQQMWSTLQAKGVWSGEIWNRRKNGEIYPEWLTINSIYDEAGQLHRRVALFTDITERKQAEAALHASEARFRGVFERAYVGISITDLDGQVLEVNDSLANILGYERHQLLGMNVAEFTHPADLALEALHIAELMTGGRDSFRMEKRYLTHSGGLVWIDLLVTVIRAADQQIHSVIRLVIDITERIRAEADLRIAATAFESQEGMMVTDAQGIILRVNQAFTQISGYSAADAVGSNPRILKSGKQEPAFYAQMWERINRTGSWQADLWNRRKDGEAFYCWLSITAVKGVGEQVSHYVGTFTDLTERKEAADKIEHLAYYDHLTQLPNRRLMLDRLRQAIINAQRHQRPGAVLLIDLDNFKSLNDTRGHAVGDLLLLEVANRLQLNARAGDSVARIGGDEFVVIIEDLGAGDQAVLQAEGVGEKFMDSLAAPFVLKFDLADPNASSISHFCTCSVGVALFCGTQITADELIKRADTAMYQAKAAGRNTLRFFDPDMQAAVQARAALEVDLRQALRLGQFLLHFQAQVNVRGKITGAEALLRWQHPVRGLVPPAEFIGLAEETGLILPLGQWVLDSACQQLALWAANPATAHLTLAVNVSARQFAQADFVERVLVSIDRAGARIDRIKLELTESLLLENADDIVAKMTQLRSRGVFFSLDDFGTGFSSLSYLKRLPLDQLKIDQSFVRDIVKDANDAAIAKTIVALGHNLGMTVIAEGVETVAQRNVLVSLGCLNYQGYYFSRPVPVADFYALLGKPATD